MYCATAGSCLSAEQWHYHEWLMSALLLLLSLPQLLNLADDLPVKHGICNLKLGPIVVIGIISRILIAIIRMVGFLL